MADSRSQMGFGHNMSQQGGQPGFSQNQFNMMHQQQQQQFNMMANQQMLQQGNPMMMQQQVHPMMAGQQANAMMQQQGMPQGMAGQPQYPQAMYPGQVPQQMPMGMYMFQQGQYAAQRFQQPGMPVQNVAPPTYTPQMAQEFKHKSEKLAARQARQIEEQRKKLEAEHRARMFQEQQKRLKEFSAIGGRKIDADSMIKHIIGPDKTRPAGAAQQATPVPPAASAPATDPDDDGDFGDFITGPSVQNFTQHGASMPSTHQPQSIDKEKNPAQSFASVSQEAPKVTQTNMTPPTTQTPPSSQPQAPPMPLQTKEENKGRDLEKMMFASCDLTKPQKAKTFEKRTLVKDAPKQVRNVTYQASQKARVWAGDTEPLTDLFVLPGSQEMQPMEQGQESQPAVQPNQGVMPGQVQAASQMSPGQIPQGQLPQGQIPQGQIPQGQLPQGQPTQQGQPSPGQMTPGSGQGPPVAGQAGQGLPVWCLGEMPVPEIYMMVLQASLREGRLETELLYPILVRSGLPREVLRTIWEMCNRTIPGQLTPQELCAALALIAVAQSTMAVPSIDMLYRLPGPPIPNLGQGPAPPPTDSNASSAIPPQGTTTPPAPQPGGGATGLPGTATTHTTTVNTAPLAAAGIRPPGDIHHSGAAGINDEDDFDDFQEAPAGVPPSDSFGDFIVASPENGSVGLPGAPRRIQKHPTEKTSGTLMGEEDKYGAFRALAQDMDAASSIDLFSGTESTEQEGIPPPLSSHAHPLHDLPIKNHPPTSPQVAAFMGQPVKDEFTDFKASRNDPDDFADFQQANPDLPSINSSAHNGGGNVDKISALKALVSDRKMYESKTLEQDISMEETREGAKDDSWDPFGSGTSLGKSKDRSPKGDMGFYDRIPDGNMEVGGSDIGGGDLFAKSGANNVFGLKPEPARQKELFPENDDSDSWGGFKESGYSNVGSTNWANFSSGPPVGGSTLAGPKPSDKWTSSNDWALSSSKNESDLTTFGNSTSSLQKTPNNELKPKKDPSTKPVSTTPKKFNYFSRNLEAMNSAVSAGTGMSALDLEPPELPDDNEEEDDFDKFCPFHAVDPDTTMTAGVTGMSSLGAPYGMDDITETVTSSVDMFGYSSRPRNQTQPQKDTADSVSISSVEFTGFKIPSGKSSKESDTQSVSSLDLTTFKQSKSSKDGSPVGGDSQSVSSLEFVSGVDRKSITPADERSVASLELKAVSTPDEPAIDATTTAQNGFGEFSSATDGPNTMFRATTTNLDYVQRPRAASELLATGDMPTIGDRYSSLVQKEEAGDQHVTEWVRCLDKCRGMLEEAANTFTTINDPTLCEEVLHSQQGTAYIQGVVEVYRVVCRITEAMRAVSATNEKLVQLLKSIDTAWLDLVTLLSDTPLKPSPGRLDFSGAVLKAEEDGAQERACGVCLLNVDAKSKRSGTNDDHKLTYGGRQYHASCANFWVNCVASMLPALKIPELL